MSTAHKASAVVEALRHTRKVLDDANLKGLLNDTIWAGPAETLFDYIDAALGPESAEPGRAEADAAAVAQGDAVARALDALPLMNDLSLLVMRMARRLSITEPGQVHVAGNQALARQAADYLKRKGLTSPLREDPAPLQAQPAAEDDETHATDLSVDQFIPWPFAQLATINGKQRVVFRLQEVRTAIRNALSQPPAPLHEPQSGEGAWFVVDWNSDDNRKHAGPFVHQETAGYARQTIEMNASNRQNEAWNLAVVWEPAPTQPQGGDATLSTTQGGTDK